MAFAYTRNPAGQIVTYDEYGVPAPGNAGRFQYTGQQWLPDAGLYHYRARAYAAGIGRFTGPDPIGYADGANLYLYVSGDPLSLVDPLGLSGLRRGDWVTYRQCVDGGGVVQKDDKGVVFCGITHSRINIVSAIGSSIEYISNVGISQNYFDGSAASASPITWDFSCNRNSGWQSEAADILYSISEFTGYVATISAGVTVFAAPTGFGAVLAGGTTLAFSTISIISGVGSIAFDLSNGNHGRAVSTGVPMLAGGAAGRYMSSVARQAGRGSRTAFIGGESTEAFLGEMLSCR